MKTNLELTLVNKRSIRTYLGGIVFGENSCNYETVSQIDILL